MNALGFLSLVYSVLEEIEAKVKSPLLFWNKSSHMDSPIGITTVV